MLNTWEAQGWSVCASWLQLQRVIPGSILFSKIDAAIIILLLFQESAHLIPSSVQNHFKNLTFLLILHRRVNARKRYTPDNLVALK